jgi:hypothetical protein
MGRIYSHRGWVVAGIIVLFMALAAIIGLGGCAGGASESVTTTAAGSVTTYAPAGVSTTMAAASEEARDSSSGAPAYGTNGVIQDDPVVVLSSLQQASGQKIISDAQMELQVEAGQFQNAFAQALLIADRYGGYIVASNSQATGEEDSLKSGTVAIRIPSSTFDTALADAGKIGEVKNRQIQTQDVTEEYVDLQARITNSKSNVQAIQALMAKAKTVDEILQVQQVLTAAQQQLEQLLGRQRYLDEHTSYSTLTMTIYEAGAVVTPPSEWGITKALKDGLHNLVNAFNSIVRGLGVLIPVLVVLAIIALLAYRIWLWAARRRKVGEAARYQPQPQGWSGHPRPPQAGPAAAPEAPASADASTTPKE